MGNKCRFCITRYGGAKYVAGMLMSVGDCGRCNGVISAKELKIMKEHFKGELELCEKDCKNMSELKKEIENQIYELDKINPIDS